MSILEKYTKDESLNVSLEHLGMMIDADYDKISLNNTKLKMLDDTFLEATDTKNKTLSTESKENIRYLFPSLEGKVNKKDGSFLLRAWDDYFTTRYRLIQGIVDNIRSLEKNVKAYRKKLKSKQIKTLKKINESNNDIHRASFIAIEQYFQYADQTYPDDLMVAVENDYTKSQELINNIHNNVIDELSNFSKIIKSTDIEIGGAINPKFNSKLKEIRPSFEFIPKTIFLNPKSMLMSSLILASQTPDAIKTKESNLERIGVRNEISLKFGEWRHDLGNALTTIFAPYLGLIGLALTVYREVNVPGYTLDNGELLKMNDIATSQLDSVEKSLSVSSKLYKDMAKLSDEIKDNIQKNGEITDYTSNLIIGYISNMGDLIKLSGMDVAKRNFQMAKGINIMLFRTINA